MTTTAWAHLPNAAHIDRVLASLEKNPEKWDEAQYAAWGAAGGAAGGAAWDVATYEVKKIVRNAARDAAWNTAWDAILALLAWDDCAYMLELPEDALKVLRAVGNEQAILLSVAANILKETS